MSSDKRDVLHVLRCELSFLEQGGYERVSKLGLPASIFQDSLTCLNHGDPLRRHACHECLLFDFVDPKRRTEDVPCHFIPLDERGTTLEDIANPKQKLEALRAWLRSTISRLTLERSECATSLKQ